MTLEEFITRSNAASSQAEVFALFQEALKALGYDSVVYSLLTDHPSIGRKAGHGVMGNYPTDWMDYYMAKEYFHKDPIPKHAFTTTAAYTWEHVVETCAISSRQKHSRHFRDPFHLLQHRAFSSQERVRQARRIHASNGGRQGHTPGPDHSQPREGHLKSPTRVGR
jgi:hypothetical protein